jgi:hypothetical protein
VILVGLARCIAMVLTWNDLACGDREMAAVLVALNAVFQVVAYAALAVFYLDILPGWLGLGTEELDVSMWDTASEVLVFDGRRQVAAHARATVRGSQTLLLDHYLEVLARKPGALPGATALAQARSSGAFTATHETWWVAARTVHGDAGGTRTLIDVLLLHRHLPAAAVVAGLQTALTIGSTSRSPTRPSWSRATTG